MRKLLYLPLALLFFFSNPLKAQTDFSAKTWHYIDSALAKQHHITDLLTSVQELYNKAINEKEYWYAARCIQYQIKIADLRSEDSLYFKNSVVIDEMLLTQQPKEIQFALHLLQANRLINFNTRYSRFERSRYERKDISINYAAYTRKDIDSIAQMHFEQAKLIAKEITLPKTDEALWLSYDPLQFLFKPDLFDIAIAEQIKSVKRNYFTAPQNVMLDKWLQLSPDGLIIKTDSLIKQSVNDYKDLGFYKQWLQYHHQTAGNYYFIEMVMRKYIYECIQASSNQAEQRYEAYLKQCSQSPYNSVKAYGVYQLCLLWNSYAKAYFPTNSSVYDYTSGKNKINADFDTTKKNYAVKAIELFESNKNMLDSFYYLKNILNIMELKIKNTEVTLTVPDYILPHDNFIAELKFKNTDTLFYTVVRKDLHFKDVYTKQNDLINVLLQQQVMQQNYQLLPVEKDMNEHNVFINMQGLPAGEYAVVFSSHQLSGDSTEIRKYVQFSVTNIAVINNDTRIYVLHRKTGMPLTGAEVNAWYREVIKKDNSNTNVLHQKNYIVNKQGFIEVPDNKYDNLTITIAEDTVNETVSFNEYEKPEDVYSEKEYDDLREYYEDNATAYIYTDRSIYRPGQTVFYKAVFITKDRNTGEPLLMTKKNLGKKMFNSMFNNLDKEERPQLQISDPFNKIVDTLNITLNEFGSVSGSFNIPKTAATGEWEIEPDDIEIYHNTGRFKVEEYKRPSYELDIQKPKRELKITDSFPVTVKVKSFAGAALSSVKIKYSIKRTADFDEYDSLQMKTVTKNFTDYIVDTFGLTNNNGELNFTVYDQSLQNKNINLKDKWHVAFDIDAEAVDASGESYDKAVKIMIDAKPVTIKVNIDAKYDRKDLGNIIVSTSDRNAGFVNKKVAIKIYKLTKKRSLYNDRKFTKADVWLYDKKTLQEQFPYDNLLNENVTETKELVYETSLNTEAGNGKLPLNAALLLSGNYTLEATCMEGEKTTGQTTKNFSVYDSKGNTLPEASLSFYHLPQNSTLPGTTIKYVYGNTVDEIYSIFHTAYYNGRKKITPAYSYEEKNSAKGIHQHNIKISAYAKDYITYTQLYILNNQLFTHNETIYISKPPVSEPEIIIEQYRKKLTPGSTETFTVSIKTNNDNIAAELMTTMYDASLDKLEQHNWEKPYYRNNSGRLGVQWTRDINGVSKNHELPFDYQPTFTADAIENRPTPLWWANPLDYAYEEILGSPYKKGIKKNYQYDINDDWQNDRDGISNKLMGRLAGVNITSTQGLNEVVVSGGYGIKRQMLTSSVSSVMLRGTSSLSSYSQPLVILDGKMYKGDLSEIDIKSITDGIVLKGADAVAIYGSEAAGGVLILSTKGPVVLPAEPEPEIKPRKNFNETAFFFPAIHANSDGFYTISFTMPESVTERNWKLLAHTQKGIFAYAERKLNSQLPLMVQPNMPRFLYQGDKIILQSRITNIDTVNANGKIMCKVEDAVTGNDITNQFAAVQQSSFAVAGKNNAAVAFILTVPPAQLHPVKITISIRSQNFSDGEEYTIPVLSPKVFVRQNTPFYFTTHQDTTITMPALPADADIFGMGLSVQPKPQAALLNSLPSLANYPYNCAEQTFNKLLAYTTAYKLIRTDTLTQHSFDAAKQFVEHQDSTKEKLPDELAAESMPWLNLDNQTATQQQQLFNLLDTSKSKDKIEALVNRLQKLQNTDGGITWFEGGKSSEYMSDYVLRGLGKLEMDNQELPTYTFSNYTYVTFLSKLINYCDADFLNNLQKKEMYDGLYYAYCRSYVNDIQPLNDSVNRLIKNMLLQQWKNSYSTSLHTQLLMIITSFKYAANEQDSLYITAVSALQSLEQLAIADDQNGLRWKEIADADDLTTAAEETVALLSEAFALQQSNKNINKGILKWLMNAKNEHSWSSTKGTAAAINLLVKENNSVSAGTQSVQITLDKKAITASNDLLKGKTFDYMPAATIPGTVQLHNQNNTAASGNVYRYYFTNAANAQGLNKEVLISKQWYKWNKSSNGWVLLLPNDTLTIADKILVELTVQNSRPLQYVFINDKRAAAFEPMENNSGYQYNGGMSFYQSVRDIGHQFFIDFIPSGKHIISYELKVAQEGSFTNGIAMLQCMYRPDITAYSNNSTIQTKK